MDIHIVDDDKFLQEILGSCAEVTGLKAQKFSSAEDYLEYFVSENYFAPKLVVLTDLQMSKMSGDKLACEIRKTNAEQKIILMTGSPKEVIHKSERLCFYLTKPIRMERLQHVFKALVECTKQGPDALSNKFNCGSLSDLDDFNIHDWRCPNRGRNPKIPGRPDYIKSVDLT